jgi:hypothetical protein
MHDSKHDSNYYISAGGPQHLAPSVSHRTHRGSLDLLGRGPLLVIMPSSAFQWRSQPLLVHHASLCSVEHDLLRGSHFAQPQCRQRFGMRTWPPPRAGRPAAGIAPPAPRATCGAARSTTTASPRTVGNFARPTGTGAATPSPHSSDTMVLKKASLVFMSQPYDGSMPPRTAGGNLGLTCSPTSSHPASLFFATQYIIRTRRR